ncbi:complement C1q-like protein 4 [Mytilus trossulus]|uniref:complement C1q-like protein 4 n=1 Tax=Mytilus trossulus TaxID=6551 RepID=UPI003003BFC9
MNKIMLPIYLMIILLLPTSPVLSHEDAKHTETRLQRLESVIKELQTDIRRLNVEITECRSTQAQKRQNSPNEVAFSTQLTYQLTGLGHHAAVIFNKVILDTTASYNSGDGVFVVPMAGIYVFTWTVSVGGGNWESTQLIVNGNPYAYSKVDTANGSDYGSGTQTVVLKVNQGDHVLIRTGTIGDGVIDGNTYDTFSGWILFPLE